MSYKLISSANCKFGMSGNTQLMFPSHILPSKSPLNPKTHTEITGSSGKLTAVLAAVLKGTFPRPPNFSFMFRAPASHIFITRSTAALANADDVYLLGHNIETIEKSTETFN
jgi:hypothetical protein